MCFTRTKTGLDEGSRISQEQFGGGQGLALPRQGLFLNQEQLPCVGALQNRGVQAQKGKQKDNAVAQTAMTNNTSVHQNPHP